MGIIRTRMNNAAWRRPDPGSSSNNKRIRRSACPAQTSWHRQPVPRSHARAVIGQGSGWCSATRDKSERGTPRRLAGSVPIA
ncbi:hypothetical protein FHS94_000391 [Sphingomonas aerophila]|uniref:Uncharacterized protein n=1 Tax=Sphingomonas aerophila TaxID=1344948 RepID=A0A7W9EUF1_9SPHN|nr:hypothetical protein [Sphingomonas aerophila]